VAGTTGVGKSTALSEFKREDPEIVIYRAVAGEGGAWGAALALCNILGLPVPNCRDLASARRVIAKALSLKSMLVVDEAQGLVKVNAKGKNDWQAFEWLRSLAEGGEFGIAFIGNLSLLQLQTEVGQLWRRVLGNKAVITGVKRDDVAAIVAQWGFSDPDLVKRLFAMARGTGAMVTLATIRRRSSRAASAPAFKRSGRLRKTFVFWRKPVRGAGGSRVGTGVQCRGYSGVRAERHGPDRLSGLPDGKRSGP